TRPHFEEHAARAARARDAGRFAQHRAAVAPALPGRGHRQVEEVRLAGRHHHDEVAEQLHVQAQGAALVAGDERVGEVAARPWMAVDCLLDGHHLREVLLAHEPEHRDALEDGAHRTLRAASSSRGNATLSRTYSGAASAASTPPPAASRGAARRATAIALGWISGYTAVILFSRNPG